MGKRIAAEHLLLSTALAAALLALAPRALAQDPADLPDLGTLTLDQLSNIKITSFTKKQQNLSQVAGAVYVITQEQIERSGLTSVPELLRLAPGIDVARVNANQWSISARGTVGVYSNKLLVLIDGRSIYSPIFAGVYWDLGMPMLNDIERIEVIRGPGATIWGANAVLGVVNIITKNSTDTHGTTVTSGVGTAERAFGSVRMGGAVGSMNYRAYVGGLDEAALAEASGASAQDGWSSVQAGFRLDGTHKRDTWMLEGDLFRGMENNIGINVSIPSLSIVETPASFTSVAGNLTGEWRHNMGSKGEFRVESYFDDANRPEPQAPVVQTRTWDTEFQYDFTAGHIHNLSAGGGGTLISTRIQALQGLGFSPSGATYSNENAFAQDEMHFLHDTLLLTAGAKLERNYFIGWGTEPSANLLWMPSKRHSFWISTARSLRTPTVFERNVDAPFTLYPASPATQGLPMLIQIDGSPTFTAETVKDFEAGYRAQLSKLFSVDATVFYDLYSNIRSYSPGSIAVAFSPRPYLKVTDYMGNDSRAIGKGGEASFAWQALPAWKVEGSYSYSMVDPYLSLAAPPGTIYAGGKDPSRNKWRIQSYLNLSKVWQLDTFLYWTSAASPTNTYGPDIFVPPYTRLDIRLGYKAGEHWQLSLAGQNLLQPRHLEALAELLTAASYNTRGVYLKSTWQF